MKNETREHIQNEGLTKIKEYRQSTLNGCVGFGKSKTTLDYIEYLVSEKNVGNILIVIHKRTHVQNWKDEFVKFNKEDLLDIVVFSTYRSLHKHSLVNNDYQAIIFDECHNVTEANEEVVRSYKNSNLYMLGLTGTFPSDSRSFKHQLLSDVMPISFTYTIDAAIKAGFLNDYTIHVHYLNLSKEKNIDVITKKAQFKTSEYANYNYANKSVESVPYPTQFARLNRMRALSDTKSKMEYAIWLESKLKQKTLIFANTRKQLSYADFPSIHSKNKDSIENLKLFKEGKFKTLASIGILNEGENIPNLKNAIVLHSYSDPGKFKQRLGRLLRLNPNEHANIHVLCYKDTIDQVWLKNSLKSYPENKIVYHDLSQ